MALLDQQFETESHTQAGGLRHELLVRGALIGVRIAEMETFARYDGEGERTRLTACAETPVSS